MRIATYNVAWFSYLFDKHDRLIEDDKPSGRYGISRAAQTRALGRVFRAIDCDAVLVVEAPDNSDRRSTVAALEHFARVFGLRAQTAMIGFANDTRQELALLYDPLRLTARHNARPGDSRLPRFDGTFHIDLGPDAEGVSGPDTVRFSKPPLELDIETEKGCRLHLIGAHLKSKAPHGARTDAGMRRRAIANRRKQLAQAIWLRARVEQHLAEGTPLIVLGDFNDGPGCDAFEGLLGRSSLDVMLGPPGPQGLFHPNALRKQTSGDAPMPSTARFWLEPDARYVDALLDYIMLSAPLMAAAPEWRIWHPIHDQKCHADGRLRHALMTASDHFPVTVDLDI